MFNFFYFFHHFFLKKMDYLMIIQSQLPNIIISIYDGTYSIATFFDRHFILFFNIVLSILATIPWAFLIKRLHRNLRRNFKISKTSLGLWHCEKHLVSWKSGLKIGLSHFLFDNRFKYNIDLVIHKEDEVELDCGGPFKLHDYNIKIIISPARSEDHKIVEIYFMTVEERDVFLKMIYALSKYPRISALDSDGRQTLAGVFKEKLVTVDQLCLGTDTRCKLNKMIKLFHLKQSIAGQKKHLQMIFFGDPGTGKSSTIRALAQILGYDIVLISSLPKNHESYIHIIKEMSLPATKMMFVFDDLQENGFWFNQFSNKRCRFGEGNVQDYDPCDVLLSMLDGVICTNRVIIITTNLSSETILKNFSPKILRNGRFGQDMFVEFEWMTFTDCRNYLDVNKITLEPTRIVQNIFDQRKLENQELILPCDFASDLPLALLDF